MRSAIWNEAGVNCEIVRGGKIHPGDAVRAVPGSYDPERCEDGGKGDTFYLRPKLRSFEQVKAGKRGLAALHQRLLKTDPEGAARVQAAYATVGLSFFPRADAFSCEICAPAARWRAWVVPALVAVLMAALLFILLHPSQ